MSKLIKSGSGLASAGRAPNATDFLEQFEGQEEEVKEVEAVETADDVLAEARQEAEVIVRTAHAEADSIRQEAYSQGYAAGTKEAAVAADELIRRLEADIELVAAERAALVDSVEPEALKLCLAAVEKIIRHEVRSDHRVVLRVVKSCLRRIRDRDQIDVRVSPQEVEAVRAHRDELLSLVEGVSVLSIADDRRVSPGGCVVDSSSGTFDARIETQFETIHRKVMETFEYDSEHAQSGPVEIPQGDQPN